MKLTDPKVAVIVLVSVTALAAVAAVSVYVVRHDDSRTASIQQLGSGGQPGDAAYSGAAGSRSPGQQPGVAGAPGAGGRAGSGSSTSLAPGGVAGGTGPGGQGYAAGQGNSGDGHSAMNGRTSAPGTRPGAATPGSSGKPGAPGGAGSNLGAFSGVGQATPDTAKTPAQVQDEINSRNAWPLGQFNLTADQWQQAQSILSQLDSANAKRAEAQQKALEIKNQMTAGVDQASLGVAEQNNLKVAIRNKVADAVGAQLVQYCDEMTAALNQLRPTLTPSQVSDLESTLSSLQAERNLWSPPEPPPPPGADPPPP